ncbi:ComF family protein [Paenibacillus sp. HJGM_3]|uniref:ComF family protein n=1 Tax=Paenibacillus sp. HJGM_3 TaxID=3379816 RepID=UPI003858D680
MANRSAVRYTDAVKPWLARFKYRGDERLKHLFVDMLESTYHRHYNPRSGSLSTQIDFLTYVPVSRERFEERGFNQAQLLAEELGLRLRIPVVPTLLRSKHTGKQSYKTREARFEDLKDAFVIHPEAQKRIFTNLPYRPICIVVIDDVYTTGSTLNHCAKVISQHLPARVYGLTWAR